MMLQIPLRVIKVKRVFHHYERWECVDGEMYNSTCEMNCDDAVIEYGIFLCDLELFNTSITRVFSEWPISCEQFLTNGSFNRVAWLGQAAMCIHSGIPRKFRAGFMLLSSIEQSNANELAHNRIREWLSDYAKSN